MQSSNLPPVSTRHSDARKIHDASDYRFGSEEPPADHPDLGDAEATHAVATSVYGATMKGAIRSFAYAYSNYNEGLAQAKILYPEASNLVRRANDLAFVSGDCVTIGKGANKRGASYTQKGLAAFFAEALGDRRQLVADCNRDVFYTEAI
jgi:hypothetical protein